MDTIKSPSLTAIVKPTYDCNFGCKYCYEGGRPDSKQYMTVDTLQTVLTKLAQYHGSDHPTRLIWHGGEPLLMGLAFFRKAIEIQQAMAPEFQFSNSIQTNATLLTSETLDFFEQHGFTVGTSLDGPRWLHDLTRPYKDGRSSFADVLRTVSQMQQRNNAETSTYVGGGVIAVFTKPALSHLDEFYEFFRSNTINVKINPIFYAGNATGAKEELGITAVEYGKAMTHLFDRWFYEKDYVIDIDPFRLILGNLITGRPQGCQFIPACYEDFIAVDPSGKVYPCGRWSSDEPFVMGNLAEQTVEKIRTSSVLSRFRQSRAQALVACGTCEFRSICNGGCVDNAYSRRHRLSDSDIYCASYRMMFLHFRKALVTELEKAQVSDMEGARGLFTTIRGRLVHVDAIQNTALRRVIHERIIKPAQDKEPSRMRASGYDDENYGDHDRKVYGVHSQDYNDKYTEYTEWHKKYHEYLDHREYSDHSRYNPPWTQCH